MRKIPEKCTKDFFYVYESMDDGTTLATEATASQQPDAHRGFREDSTCPE